MKTNIALQSDFSQVCVWPATIVGETEIETFHDVMLARFGVRTQYLEEIKTAPDMEDGQPVEDTGGRNDLFFAIHKEDVGKFALPRLEMGIRWIEDAIGEWNGGNTLYPTRVNGYVSWD